MLLHGQEIGVLRMGLDTVGFKGNAAVWGGAEEGGYRPIHAASFQWTAGAEAKAVSHGENTSWTGAFSFEQMMGQYKNRNGYSMLLDPDYFPLDIVEFSPGTKSRETVRLEGGFLREFGYELAAGIKASVQAAYTSKQKDISHKDFAMTVQVEPTVTFGRNQLIESEVNVDYCRKHHIHIYRRKSGGGCVYADRDNLMLSFVTSGDNVAFNYNRFMGMILLVLRKLGIEATSTQHNDVMIGDRKVSGFLSTAWALHCSRHVALRYKHGTHASCHHAKY